MKILTLEEFKDWKELEATQTILHSFAKTRLAFHEAMEVDFNLRELSIDNYALYQARLSAKSQILGDIINLDYEAYKEAATLRGEA